MTENKFDDFIQEVDEELKWEKLERLFKEYGAYLIGGVLAIILGVAGYVYWNHRVLVNEELQSSAFTKAASAAREGQIEESLKQLDDLIAQGHEYAMLSQFEKAALLVSKPETKEEGAALYRSMIEDRKVDRRYRSLAVIFYVQSHLDAGDAQEMMRFLREISNGSNLFPSITSELMALVALRSGDVAQAKSVLEDLVNSQDTSSGVRERANAMLSTLNQTSKGE